MALFHSLTAAEFVARALAQRGPVLEGGVGCYKLGAGARYDAPSCYAPEGNQFPGFCDCSGLLAWAGQWADPGRGAWNTDSIVDDAIHAQKRFALVAHDVAVRAGDIVVKPGPDLDHDGHRDHPGHCGVVTKVLPEFVRGGHDWWEWLLVTHCSGALQLHLDPATGKPYGAVRETNAAIWALDGYIIRPLHVTE